MKNLLCWLTIGVTCLSLAVPAGGNAAASQNRDAPLTYAALQALIQADLDARLDCMDSGDQMIFKIPNKSDKRQKLFRQLRYSPIPANIQLNDGDPKIASARNLVEGFRALSDTASYRQHLAGLVQTFDASELAQRYARLMAADRMFALAEVQSFPDRWTDFGATWLQLEEEYVVQLGNKHPHMAAEKVWLPAQEMTLIDCWNGAHMHRWFDCNLALQNSAFARTATMLERWGSRISIKYIEDAREAAQRNLERVEKVLAAEPKAMKALAKVEKKAGKLQLLNDIAEVDSLMILNSIKSVDARIVEISDRLLAKNGVAYRILSEKGICKTLGAAVAGGATESRGPQFMTLSKNAVAKARKDLRAAYERAFGRPMLIRPTKPHNVFK